MNRLLECAHVLGLMQWLLADEQQVAAPIAGTTSSEPSCLTKTKVSGLCSCHVGLEHEWLP